MAAIRKYLDYTPSVSPDVYLAETAVIIGRVSVGKNTNIWDGVVVRGDMNPVTIGKGVSVQDNVVIHEGSGMGEDTIIGDYSILGHGCIVHGCKIEENCMIGMGAIILNNALIRKNSIVAAGSLVTEGKDFPEGSLIMGSPAKVVRVLDDAELEKIRRVADHYIQMAEDYKNTR
jgi:carbonic anhydrase/acetyltransferase-like protein (isoleucine patch superfamily)